MAEIFLRCDCVVVGGRKCDQALAMSSVAMVFIQIFRKG
jgi:hypothetical protein